MASGKKSGKTGKSGRKKTPLEFRNVALVDALQTQDMAAVAFALRHGPTVVPLMKTGTRDNPLDTGEIWTYRDPNTGDIALLLFSDATHKPETLPPAVALQSPESLKAILEAHQAEITTVFFDIAGPHPMQATPADLLAALSI
ncbi:dehydrogenase [Microbacterium sp. P01]|uniref:dehydrogenase n=1 Tax=unclassified Microbacterium TaxID=2609290 RepID=UPI00366AFF09